MPQLKIDFDGSRESFHYNRMSKGRSYELEGFDGFSGTTVQPVIKDYQQFDFLGKSKIHSHVDVANLMAVLESKSTEHFFAVHVNKSGEPLIQYVSTGGRDAVHFDKLNIHAIASYHNTRELYLVHNHPSGNLTPSKADLCFTRDIAEAYSPLNVKTQSLIINTYKNEYNLIEVDSLKSESTFMIHPKESKNMDVSYRAVTYHDMNILREPLGKIRHNEDAFALIQQKRFSALPKYGLFIIAQDASVLANFIVDQLDLKTMVKAVASVPNGRGVLAYGNRDVEDIQAIKAKLAKFDVPLLDYIQFNSNGKAIQKAYNSYYESGVLNEIQTKFQTNNVLYTDNVSQSLKR